MTYGLSYQPPEGTTSESSPCEDDIQFKFDASKKFKVRGCFRDMYSDWHFGEVLVSLLDENLLLLEGYDESWATVAATPAGADRTL